MSTIVYGHPDVPLVLRLEEPIFVSFAPFGRLAWNAGTGEVGPGQLSLFLYGSALRALRSACEKAGIASTRAWRYASDTPELPISVFDMISKHFFFKTVSQLPFLAKLCHQ